MGDNQLAGTGIKNIQSLETTRRQLRCESSKNVSYYMCKHQLYEVGTHYRDL